MGGTHGADRDGNERSLWIALLPTAGFMVAESSAVSSPAAWR